MGLQGKIMVAICRMNAAYFWSRMMTEKTVELSFSIKRNIGDAPTVEPPSGIHFTCIGPLIALLQEYATVSVRQVSNSECRTVGRILNPLQHECIYMSEARTRGGAERSLNTLPFFSIPPNLQRFVKPKCWPNFTSSSSLLPSQHPLLCLYSPSFSPPSRQNMPPHLPPTLCSPAKDRLDEEQYDHRWRPQVSDAEQTGRADAEYSQAEPVWWGKILLQGNQRSGSGWGGVQAGGSRYAAWTLHPIIP